MEKMHKIENEHHVLLKCEAYNDIRHTLFQKLTKIIPDINNLDDKLKFKTIIGNSNTEAMTILGKFLVDMEKIRNS